MNRLITTPNPSRLLISFSTGVILLSLEVMKLYFKMLSDSPDQHLSLNRENLYDFIILRILEPSVRLVGARVGREGRGQGSGARKGQLNAYLGTDYPA